MMISNELEKLNPLVEKLKNEPNLHGKRSILLEYVGERVLEKKISTLLQEIKKDSNILLEVVLLSLVAINQTEVLLTKKALKPLEPVEIFFESIGGIVGYHTQVLYQLSAKKESSHFDFALPEAFDISKEEKCREAILKGILALPFMAEIYLVGGLGDRLKLKNPKGDPLPAATLNFCGKSLLEIMLRDVFGREYLYFKLFHKKVTIPVALMTSLEKDNEKHIRQLLRQNNWYERGEESFFLFKQVLVPVITEEGDWVVRDDGDLLLHPGGHGTLWKAALDEGVYDWFEKKNKKAFLIRQINNPIAGLDYGLLALSGTGFLEGKTFGVASCKRLNQAQEGVLVTIKNNQNEMLTVNIEYTEASQKSIDNQVFPTNTNILFVHLKSILNVIKHHPIPDFLLNMKTKIFYKTKEMLSGRLESMVQNITHHLPGTKKQHPVFLTFNERNKTISTTKRSFDPEKGLLETPEGAFYDLMKEAFQLLTKKCEVTIPTFSSIQEYLDKGPSLLFLYHPALGPLYEIISQKIIRGVIKHYSELQLEISELLLEEIYLDGSLIIETEKPFSETAGRCFLKRVKIINKGIQRSRQASYWNQNFKRKEACHIILENNAELFAEDVTLVGNQTIHVPANTRFIAYQEGETIFFEKEEVTEPSLWQYQLEGDQILLSLNPDFSRTAFSPSK